MCRAEQLPSAFCTEHRCLSDNCLLTRDAAPWQVLLGVEGVAFLVSCC